MTSHPSALPRIGRTLAAGALVVTVAAVLSGCGLRTPAPPAVPVPDPDPASSGFPIGTSLHTIQVGGENRDYRVHRPASTSTSADGSTDVPLVVMLHGGFGSAEQAETTYGWDAQADADGFVVAYPDGAGRAWNAGGGCCGTPGRTGVDDVAFIAAMVDEIGAGIPIDAERTFATGMSNGAIMTYRLACETDLFAAIAPVAGTQLVTTCEPPSTTSVFAVHGLLDTSVPFDGSAGQGAADIDGPPVGDVQQFWRTVDGCGAPTIAARADPLVVDTVSADCADGASVSLVTVADAGHQWPGAPSSAVRDELGGDPPSERMDATREIATFFAGVG